MLEILRIATTFGDAVVLRSRETATDVKVAFDASWTECDVAIPPRFHVERAIIIELSIVARMATSCLLIDFVLEGRPAVVGSPQSGEWLDSICFERPNQSLSLGVRDAEWLRYVRDLSSECRISYLLNGIRLEFPELREGQDLRIPLGIAIADGPEHNLASWFGVDAALPISNTR